MNKYSNLTDEQLAEKVKKLTGINLSDDEYKPMELIEIMRQSGKYCCISIVSDYHYTWDMSATISELFAKHHKPCATSFAETFHRATMLLYLRAEDAYNKFKKKGKKK